MYGAQMDAVEREADARHHLFSPAEEMAKLGDESRPLLAYGEGIYVVDTRGRRLIDGPAGMWCTQVGYARQEIADAISAQAMRLSYNSPWYTTNSPAAATRPDSFPIVPTRLRFPRRLPLQRHVGLDPGDQPIAVSDDRADPGIAGARLGAVEAMDPTVAVAGLAAAFPLKPDPRLHFPHHSNPMNSAPPPPGARRHITGGSYPRGKAGG